MEPMDANEPSLRNSFLRMSLLVDQTWWSDDNDAYLWENLKLWKQAVQENCPEFIFPPGLRHPLIWDDAQRDRRSGSEAQAYLQIEVPVYNHTQAYASTSGPGLLALARRPCGENSLEIMGPSNQSLLNQIEEGFEVNEEQCDEQTADAWESGEQKNDNEQPDELEFDEETSKQESDGELVRRDASTPWTSDDYIWSERYLYFQGRAYRYQRYSPDWNRGRGGRPYYRPRNYFPRWHKRGRRGGRGWRY